MVVNDVRLATEKIKILVEQLTGKITLNSYSNGRGFDTISGDLFIILKEINEQIKIVEKQLLP